MIPAHRSSATPRISKHDAFRALCQLLELQCGVAGIEFI